MKKTLLFTLMLAAFLDIGNFFMPMPIYAPLLMTTSFFSGSSQESKAVILGLLIASYGVAQLFAGPLLGQLSDQHGRRKILLICLIFSTIGCFISGAGLKIENISYLFLGRLLVGASSSTVAIIFALIADYSRESERARYLGYISVGISAGCALGPIMGGHLASNPALSWFGYSTPFYFMGGVYLFTWIVLFKLLPPDGPLQIKSPVTLLKVFKSLYSLLARCDSLRNLIWMILFLQIGVESFYLAAPILAIKNFQMKPIQIANCFLVFGLLAFITSWFINKFLSCHFKSIQIYGASILMLAISFSFLFDNQHEVYFYFPFLGIGVFATLCWIHSNSLLSQLADRSQQGLIFGVSQALWSIGGIIGGTLVGFITAIHYPLIAVLPPIFTAFSWVIALSLIKRFQPK